MENDRVFMGNIVNYQAPPWDSLLLSPRKPLARTFVYRTLTQPTLFQSLWGGLCFSSCVFCDQSSGFRTLYSLYEKNLEHEIDILLKMVVLIRMSQTDVSVVGPAGPELGLVYLSVFSLHLQITCYIIQSFHPHHLYFCNIVRITAIFVLIERRLRSGWQNEGWDFYRSSPWTGSEHIRGSDVLKVLSSSNVIGWWGWFRHWLEGRNVVVEILMLKI